MPPRLPALRPLVAPSKPFTSCLLQPALVRHYAAMQKKPSQNKKTKAARTSFRPSDLEQIDQFSLVDAMRYIRAMEVGRDPVQTKYELHVKLKTGKSGPTIKSRIRLPKPVKTDMRICVIAEGKQAEAAKRAGAVLVGTDEVFEKMRNGELDFDKVLCHDASFAALNKARLGRVLGPKGLMPSQKFGTVVPNITNAMRDLVGGSDYRERLGVIRFPIGQLAFTELELLKNIRAFMEQLKKEFGALSYRADKSIDEVVLSSTHSAGFSLSGELRSVQRASTGSAAVAGMGETQTQAAAQAQMAA
ncbi:mitochondrial large ribosomal subunit protein L1 [Geopyxis carbonaria]|nr:mitochondrial large ribosomal subunit protein L1 [Geopyxis carbonaria]